MLLAYYVPKTSQGIHRGFEKVDRAPLVRLVFIDLSGWPAGAQKAEAEFRDANLDARDGRRTMRLEPAGNAGTTPREHGVVRTFRTSPAP